MSVIEFDGSETQRFCNVGLEMGRILTPVGLRQKEATWLGFAGRLMCLEMFWVSGGYKSVGFRSATLINDVV